VSGRTMINARFQPDQNLWRTIQKSRSDEVSWGRGQIRLENGKLLSQCDNLKEQPAPSAERAEDQTEEKPQRSEHEAVLSENTLRKSGVKRG
jgi:hypothetical protein